MNKETFIEGWLRFTKSESSSEEHERYFWAFEEMDKLVWDKPREAVEIMIEILDRDFTDEVIYNMAAGPAEDLLSIHLDSALEIFRVAASQSLKFKTMLGGVWTYGLAPNLCKEFERIRS